LGFLEEFIFSIMATTKEKKNSKVIDYFQNSYEEIRKVAWPTRNQAMRLTFLVLGFMIVTALVIGILDFVFGFGHSFLLDIAPDRALPAAVTTEQSTPSAPSSNEIGVGSVTATTADGDDISVEAVTSNSSSETNSEKTSDSESETSNDGIETPES